MDLDKNIRICNLIDIYGNLLSDKQLKMLKHYYFEDMSLSEIADIENISRPAVLDSLHVGIKKVELYETKIGMLSLIEKLKACVATDDVKKELTKILEEI